MIRQSIFKEKLMNNKDRMDLALWVMNTARKSGADEAAVSLSNRREVEIEVRDRKPDQVKESVQNSLSLDIYAEKKYSGHSTNDLGKDSLKRFIDEAVRTTRYLTPDPFRSLPDPGLYPVRMDRDLKKTDPAYDQVDSQMRIALARAAEDAAMAQSDRIISVTASYSDMYSTGIKVHSNGFQGESVSTQFWVGAEVTVDDRQGGRPEDGFYAGTRFMADLPEPESVGRQAADRALRKIGQDKIESGRYMMLVENRAVSRLIGVLGSAMSARALQQKRSFLDGKLGQRIGSEHLTLIDDPFIEKGLGSRFYDGEGLAQNRRILVEKGVLNSYLIDHYYGQKLGMTPNSGSTSNLLMDCGDQSPEEMIKTIPKGLLITGFIGGNSNSTTGDFSFGIVGLFIENGQVMRPVNEMNVSGNAVDFWNRLTAVGNDPYPYSSLRMPTLMFEDVHFSGI